MSHAERAPAFDRHRRARRHLALDVAVAIQAFGPRPTAFLAMRDELDSPTTCTSAAATRPGCGRSAWPSRCAALEPPGRGGHGDRARPGRTGPQARPGGSRRHRGGGRPGCQARGVVHRSASFWLRRCARRSPGHDPGLWPSSSALFPEVKALDDELFVDDGDVLSSGGMLAAADHACILREDHGQSYANDVSRLLVSPPYRSRRPGPVPGQRARSIERLADVADGVGRRPPRRAPDASDAGGQGT